MNIIKKLSIFIWLLIPFNLLGQLAPLTNQYILNPLTINPASAGGRGALDISAFYRKQWVGVAGAPTTMTLSIDAPFLDSKLGLGLIISNDILGVTKESRINTNYSYKIKLNEGVFSLGLGAGFITTNTAWSELLIVDQEDNHYLTDSRVYAVPDFSFGAYYSFHNYFGGISIPKLLGYDFNFDKNKYSLKVDPEQYYYMLNTGYLFEISSKTKLMPSVLVIFSAGKKLMYDINAHISLFDRLWAGLSYRSSNSMAGLLQFAVNDQLKVAYSYDFDFGEIGRYSNGSHEIMIRYEFRWRLEAVKPTGF